MSNDTGWPAVGKTGKVSTRSCRAAACGLCCTLHLMLFNWPDAMAQVADATNTALETAQQVDRAYGLQIGDLVTRTVSVGGRARQFAPERLPEPGPLSAWLTLASVVVDQRSESADGSGSPSVVTLTYQITGAAPVVTLVHLPALQLFESADDQARVLARLDAMPVSVSPIIGERPFQRVGLGDLQPDALAPITPRAGWQWLLWTMTGLVLSLSALLAARLWWRQRPQHQTPFKRASTATRSATDVSDAYRELHRAFDRTAQRSIMLDDIPGFLTANPAYKAVEADIQAFFERSREQFFHPSENIDPNATTTQNNAELAGLREIADRLARIEQRLV